MKMAYILQKNIDIMLSYMCAFLKADGFIM